MPQHSVPLHPDFDVDRRSPHPSQLDLKLALNNLIHGDFQQRWEGVKQFSEVGEGAIAPLLALLQDEEMDWEVRWFAARALGQFQQPPVLAALLDLLITTSDEELQTAAAAALGQFGAASITALSQLMEQPGRRLLAVQTLVGIRHPDTLTLLLAAVSDADAAVRAVAIAALGNFQSQVRTDKVTGVLLQALRDPAAAVRQEAVTALGRWVEQQNLPELVHPLVTCLWDVSLSVCQAAARTLGRLGTEPAIAAMTQVLQSPHTPDTLQIALVQGLGWRPQPATLAALIATWESASAMVRLEIIHVLGRMETPPLQQAAGAALCDWLRSRLDDPQAVELKQALVMALGQLQIEEGRSLLVQLCADADERVQIYATAALRQLVP